MISHYKTRLLRLRLPLARVEGILETLTFVDAHISMCNKIRMRCAREREREKEQERERTDESKRKRRGKGDRKQNREMNLFMDGAGV